MFHVVFSVCLTWVSMLLKPLSMLLRATFNVAEAGRFGGMALFHYVVLWGRELISEEGDKSIMPSSTGLVIENHT